MWMTPFNKLEGKTELKGEERESQLVQAFFFKLCFLDAMM
jgi:hypothetical protein